VESNGIPMAILALSDLLKNENPRSALLEFLEFAYIAGAKKATWDIEKMKVPPLEEVESGTIRSLLYSHKPNKDFM
jgi:hypothetical protein